METYKHTQKDQKILLNTLRKMTFLAGSQKKLAESLSVSESLITRWIQFKSKPTYSICQISHKLYSVKPENLRPDIKFEDI